MRQIRTILMGTIFRWRSRRRHWRTDGMNNRPPGLTSPFGGTFLMASADGSLIAFKCRAAASAGS